MNNIQFELWKNCSNGCKFCFNRGLPCSSIEDKIRIIKEVKYRLERLNYDYYDKIGLIGGELFGDQIDDEQVFSVLYDLFEFFVTLIKQNKINQINFTTNLLNPNNEKMFKILNMIQKFGVLNRFELCTSYDSKYRFNNNFDLWDQNMLYIMKTYPGLQTHIEILPTQDFCEKCLSGEISLLSLKKRYYNSSIDYSDLNSGFLYKDKFDMEKHVPGFFPKRSTFLSWVKEGLKSGWFRIEDICNYSMFFNELYMLDSTNHFRQIIRSGHDKQLPYGQIDKSDYIDSDIPMYKDLESIKKRMLHNVNGSI